MIRHLLRLAWNRKAKNALLSLELLIAFLVLLVVMVVFVAGGSYLSRPLGYDYGDVIVVEFRDEVTDEVSLSEDRRLRTHAVMGALRVVPGVLEVAGATDPPMSAGGNTSTMVGAGGRIVQFWFEEVTDDFADAMDVRLVAGRWFGPEDDGSPDRAVVINRRLAISALSDPSPIGRDLLGDATLEPGEKRMRVVGVVEDLRLGGELSLPVNFLFHRKRLEDAKTRPPRTLLIEFDPGRREGLEKRIEDTARAAAPGWRFSVKPLSAYRTEALRGRLAPAIAVSLVALFLLAMVAMGLAGVFWQSVAQRRSEIGVRRAAGATPGAVVRQIVGEVWAMVTLVAVVGLVLAAQLPLLGVARVLGVRIFLVAVAAAVVFIYLLAGLAALAPAAMAARIQPADALRTE